MNKKILRRHLNGILLLDKPAGISSNGILQRSKYLFQAKKAGHTGSLDPLATGMLPICFGEATKFSQFLLDADKTYYVVAKLGERTTTGDKEGEVIETRPVVDVDERRLLETLKQFLGEQDQIPPMYSALKVQGKPLYELARQGIEIERKSRRITIFSLDFAALTEDGFSFRVHCSKGTYVRTLVEDIGEAMGCGAHVTVLHRESVSPYGQKPMYTWAELEALLAQGLDALSSCLLPLESAVQGFPEIKFSPFEEFQLRSGQTLAISPTQPASLVRLATREGKFFGVGEIGADGRIKSQRLLATPAFTGATPTI